MDEAADHFKDIFGPVDELMDFEPGKVGVLEFNAKGTVPDAGVALTGSHARQSNGTLESSLGVSYEGNIGGLSYSLDTNLNPGESMEAEVATSKPVVLQMWPMSGLLLGFGVKGELSNDADGDSTHEVTVEIEKPDLFQHTIHASKLSSPGSENATTLSYGRIENGLQITNSVTYPHSDSTTLGAAFSYDGGAAQLVKGAVTAAHRLANATLAFLATASHEGKESTYSFTTGVRFDVSENIKVAGTYTTESSVAATGSAAGSARGSSASLASCTAPEGEQAIAIAGQYDVSNHVSLKARYQGGLYSFMATVLLSAHLTATLLLQQGTGPDAGPATRGGVVLTYDDSETNEPFDTSGQDDGEAD
eukprot:TRINITY_DN17005_c0_g1_i1.p1 TRINITY_DN17005_c0_g1~~TRINITY_DN17005_c0_g1_i1.p1  ORF type:complete len:379 (+),score=123.37 TRINITY_DN17005_c0_g1_i1:50-1138(+)